MKKGRYTIKDIMPEHVPEYVPARGIWNYIKRILGFKYEVVDIAELKRIADIICQTNELIKEIPFIEGTP